MFQGFAQQNRSLAPRRTVAVLLAVILNLALVPCTMALELVEEAHDCCPPELRLDPSDCCQIDIGGGDARTGVIKVDYDDGVNVSAPAYADLAQAVAGRRYLADDPPDPPDIRPDLNALLCVYLK